MRRIGYWGLNGPFFHRFTWLLLKWRIAIAFSWRKSIKTLECFICLNQFSHETVRLRIQAKHPHERRYILLNRLGQIRDGRCSPRLSNYVAYLEPQTSRLGCTSPMSAVWDDIDTHSHCSDSDSSYQGLTFTIGNQKRGRDSMTRSLSGNRSCSKRLCAEGANQWQTLLEQVTPESASTSSSYSGCCGPYLPYQFEDEDERSATVKEAELVDGISNVLETTCLMNEAYRLKACGRGPYRSEKYPDGSSSIFFSLRRPGIVLRSYVSRLVKYMRVSKSVFIVGMIYLDRVREDDELLNVTELNVHRLLTTALTLSSKYLEDETHRNSTVSRIGGVPSTIEMNMLEVQFLRRLQWNCGVSSEAYGEYEKTIFGREPDSFVAQESTKGGCHDCEIPAPLQT